MKRYQLRSTLASLSLCLFVALPALAVDWNHDPESSIGPEFWGNLDPGFITCKTGTSQSPVDIALVAQGSDSALLADYHDVPLEVENNGHVIEVAYALPDEPTSLMRIGGELYRLLQFHFHAPSEHEVNGQLADMEMHLVHQNVATGQLAVVGVLLVEGDAPNPLIEEIFANAPEEEGAVVHVEGAVINAQEVLPGFLEAMWSPDAPYVLNRYWTYSGSLTTPPCTEGVRWFVLKEPVEVSAATVDRMHELVGLFPTYRPPVNSRVWEDNNRPVQPLNDRAITDRDR